MPSMRTTFIATVSAMAGAVIGVFLYRELRPYSDGESDMAMTGHVHNANVLVVVSKEAGAIKHEAMRFDEGVVEVYQGDDGDDMIVVRGNMEAADLGESE